MEATTAQLRPYVPADGETVDEFDTRSVAIPAARLQPGMILMDETLGTPAVAIDHFTTASRGSGCRAFLGQDLETGRYAVTSIHRNATVQVLAR